MKKLLIISLLICYGSVNAQQTASFAQYAFNILAINPGYAGSHNLLSASFISRFQNVGLEGAPNTQTVSLHTPLWNKSLAVGGLMIRDAIGVISQTGMHGILAYRIFFDEDGEHSLSFGMQFGMITYSANYADLLSFQPNDPFFAENIRQTRPNVGAGAFYRTPTYFLGLSMPHMMNNVFDRGENFTTVNQSIPVLLNGGYIYTINPVLKFKPNFLFKMLDGRFVEFDLNGNIQIDDLLWLGISYRFPGINLMTEIRLSEQMRLGYSYALDRGKVREVGLGTHEILINYRFKFTKYKLVSPRYF